LPNNKPSDPARMSEKVVKRAILVSKLGFLMVLNFMKLANVKAKLRFELVF
jgi:hypothetical protein